MALLKCDKEVDQVRTEIVRHCKEIGRRLAFEYGSTHIKILDGETLRPVIGADGTPLTLPTTPSDVRWKHNTKAKLRKAGLLPRIEQKPASQEQIKQRRITLPDRIGRLLRTDISPASRRAFLREIADLVVAANGNGDIQGGKRREDEAA